MNVQSVAMRRHNDIARTAPTLRGLFNGYDVFRDQKRRRSRIHVVTSKISDVEYRRMQRLADALIERGSTSTAARAPLFGFRLQAKPPPPRQCTEAGSFVVHGRQIQARPRFVLRDRSAAADGELKKRISGRSFRCGSFCSGTLNPSGFVSTRRCRRSDRTQRSSSRRRASSRSMATTPSAMVGAGVASPRRAGTTSASSAW